MSNSRNVFEVLVAIFALVMKIPPILKWFMEAWAGNSIYGFRSVEVISHDAAVRSAWVWMSQRWVWLGHAWPHSQQCIRSPGARISAGCLSFSSQCLWLSNFGAALHRCLERGSHPHHGSAAKHSSTTPQPAPTVGTQLLVQRLPCQSYSPLCCSFLGRRMV